MSQPHVDQPPASPAEALDIIERERGRHDADLGGFYLLWGAAWIVIGLSWFAAATEVWPRSTAGVITLVVVVVGFATSMALGSRMDRGIEGPTRTAGTMFGVMWAATMLTTSALAAGLAGSVAPTMVSAAPGIVFPGLFVFVAGTIYLVTAAFCRSRLDFGLGLFLQLVAVASVFTPLPWNSLVMGLAGGGALIAVGLARQAQRVQR